MINEQVGSLFLDSGAHSLYSKYAKGGDYSYFDSSDFWAYLDDYALWIKKYPHAFDYYANVDVIYNPELSWKVLKFLEQEHGLNPVPVIHSRTALKWVHKHLEAGYKYIGLGGLGQLTTKSQYYAWADSVFSILCPKSNDYHPIVDVHGFAMTSYDLLVRYPWACMTDSHKVLTKHGWKGRTELGVGEQILTYKKGVSQWQTVISKPEYDFDDYICILRNRSFRAYVTPNHRWVTYTRSGKEKWVDTLRLFETEKTDIRIPRQAEHIDFPEQETYRDQVIELLAWMWTDGCHKKRKRYKTDSVSIYQSTTKNPKLCEEIRQLLNRCGDGWCETKPGRDNVIQFEIYGSTAQEVLTIAPSNKIIPHEFVTKLTKRQLMLFIHTALKGDGRWTNRLVRRECFEIVQRNRRNLDVFRTAAILAGYATSEFAETLRTSSVPWVYSRKLICSRAKYKGKVWCVTVPDGAFFTKCGTDVYVTGNSVDSASWAKAGAYGVIYVPAKGKRDLLKRPYSIAVSLSKSLRRNDKVAPENGFDFVDPSHIASTPAAYRRNKHLFTVSKAERRIIEQWLDEIEVPLGSVDKEGKELEWGVVSNYQARKIANLKFFTAVQNYLTSLEPRTFNVQDAHLARRGLGV